MQPYAAHHTDPLAPWSGARQTERDKTTLEHTMYISTAVEVCQAAGSNVPGDDMRSFATCGADCGRDT